MQSPFERVRASCESLVALNACSAKVNDAKIRDYVAHLDWTEFEKLAAETHFPVEYASRQDEANFITLYSMLSFGSGYRKELHLICGRGANDMISAGLVAMFKAAPHLDAHYLQGLSLEIVSTFFGLPLPWDKDRNGIIQLSPLHPLAVMIHKALTESGHLLSACGTTDFGEFVRSRTRPDKKSPPTAACLIEQLVSTFPAFGDQREARGAMRYFYKRAQLAACMLYRRFEACDPEFAFTDVDQLTATSDNVIPCVLNALGIVEYEDALQQHIARGDDLPPGMLPANTVLT